MSDDSEPHQGLSPAQDDPESESKLTHLLITNDPPTDTEITLVQEIIRRAEAAEPASASESLLRVARIDSYRAIISPVRRLPLELLMAILCFVKSSRRFAPWALGHVCRTWRAAALACPSLWSLIRVPNMRSGDFLHSAVNEQLSRTGNAPLRIWWRDGFTGKVSAEIIQSLLPTSHRWVAITLTDFREDKSHKWIANFKGHLPALQRLEIFEADSVSLGDVFLEAPKLTHVLLSKPEHYADSPSWMTMSLPADQITHYRATYIAQGHFHVLTANASHLVQCVLAGRSYSWEIPMVDIVFPNLQRLHISDLRMLERFTAPALRVLCIFSEEHGAGVEDDAFAFILPFLERSGRTSALSQLNLFDCDVTPERIVDLLCALTGLRSLLLEAAWRAKIEVLDALICKTDRPDILPNLTWFVWGYCKDTPPPEVFTVVESRIQRLAFFRIYQTANGIPLKPTESVSAVVQRLRRAGVDAGVVRTFSPMLKVELWGRF
ncbi:hypothetical protein C8F01DRAFT_1238587 [Mycena amicta]|nr:hypothetical protein C8F01DRAFT_1238587 [Mycena amicta]